VLLGLDEDGAVAIAEKVSPAAVAPVERPRVATVDHLHTVRQVGALDPNDQVVVRSHQAVREASQAEARKDFRRDSDERQVVLRIVVDRAGPGTGRE
jgi:hypothetical protein